MPISLDVESAAAVFTLPKHDGVFDAAQAQHLRALGQRRPSIMLAFAPKAAGTFLRSAAIAAVDGQLTRVIHAQGGRDATPYLPIYSLYLSGGFPESTLVTHVHMQALPANRHFIEALDLKPVIMLRAVPDMLVSYLDMLTSQPASPSQWLNASIPENFYTMGETDQLDFMIATMLPWYASYFATWQRYVKDQPGRVCVLKYRDLRRDPVVVLETLLFHSRLPRSREMCALAVEATWDERHANLFNRGEEGRGNDRLTSAQLRQIEQVLFGYYGLDAWRAELMPR